MPCTVQMCGPQALQPLGCCIEDLPHVRPPPAQAIASFSLDNCSVKRAASRLLREKYPMLFVLASAGFLAPPDQLLQIRMHSPNSSAPARGTEHATRHFCFPPMLVRQQQADHLFTQAQSPGESPEGFADSAARGATTGNSAKSPPTWAFLYTRA